MESKIVVPMVYFLTHECARCLGFKGLINLHRNNDLGRSKFPSWATLRVVFIKNAKFHVTRLHGLWR